MSVTVRIPQPLRRFTENRDVIELSAGTVGEALEQFGERAGLEEARGFATLLQQSQELGTSLIIVTHDTGLADRMDRQFQLIDGRLNPL